MITYNIIEWKSDEKYIEGTCLSTDTKPTQTVLMNGSKLMEMDTSTLYMYDKENQIWRAW